MKNIVKILKRVLIILSVVLLLFGCAEKTTVSKDKDIVILYTNDIHCGINENIGLAGLMQYYKDLKKTDVYTALVDAGDFSQGDVLGSLTEGELMYQVLSYLNYDVITLGNHEFDYGIYRLFLNAFSIRDQLCCANFVETVTDVPVFEPYKILTFGDKKVAFIGITTPNTIHATSEIYYLDEEGNYEYGFLQGNDGKNLYNRVQKYVDECKSNGANYVIIVSHLGETKEFAPYNSVELIKNLSGVDAIIDGHSHVKYQDKYIDKEGKEVLAAETGTKMQSFGKLVIDKDGNITNELIEQVNGKDQEVQDGVDELYNIANRLLNKVVYADNNVELTINNSATGERISRKSETNLGDFVADAYKYAGKTDVALINGGGLRDSIKKGNISYNTLLKTFPFSNMVCTCEIKGQDLVDVLELGVKNYPEESGGFMHVAGIEYTVDTTIDSNVKLDENGMFDKVDGKYRVQDVKINGEPIDLQKTYTLTNDSYHIVKHGDGCKMFENVKVLEEDIMVDIEAVVKYLKVVDMSKYENEYGDGRIKIIVN